MTGAEIAAAFTQQNDKKSWKARCGVRTNIGDVVYFEATNGMVSLMYRVDTGQFAVKFTKFQGAWGDYVKAIARSLFTILNTLKSAGLPFDAPATLAGMVIESTTTDTTDVYVRWPGQIARDSWPTHARANTEPLSTRRYRRTTANHLIPCFSC
jgi:hypothetical protein